MPYARKRRRVYRRRPYRKRAKRRYSSAFRRRRSTLAKAFASRRRYRNSKLLAQFKPGTLSFGNKYVRDVKPATLTYRAEQSETILATPSGSSPLECQFGQTFLATSALFNVYGPLGAPESPCENWDVYSSKYSQVYVKNITMTCEFSTQDNRTFSDDPNSLQVQINPTTYICGIMISREPLPVELVPIFKWSTVQKLGNVVYKKYTAGVTRALKVTAKVDVGKCLQQYDMNQRVHVVMPLNCVYNQPSTTIPTLQPQDNRLYLIPFVVPMTKSAVEGSAYTIEYKTTIHKRVVFTRPLSDLAQLNGFNPTNNGSFYPYPPQGTNLLSVYRPMSIDGDFTPPLNEDVKQNERLDVLEMNDDEQDSKIQDNENAIQSVDQQVGIVTDDLNQHIVAQFPNVH